MPTLPVYQVQSYGTGSVRIRAADQTEWTVLPPGTTGFNVTYFDLETNNLEGDDMAIACTSATWAFNTNITVTTSASTTNEWIWGNQYSTGTRPVSWPQTIRAWQDKYKTMRVQRAQNDLQRAMTAARGAGDSRHEWNIGEWAADCDVDLEDFSDEQSGLVMEMYLQSYALRVDRDVETERRHAREEDAKAKAEHLLTSLLSAAQKREWLASRWVTEISPTGRIWRLIESAAGGQLLIDPKTDARYATLCVHPTGQMPVVDHMVGVLLAIRNGDEDMLLAKANIHAGNLRPEDRDLAQEYRRRLYAPTAPAAAAAEAIAV